MNIVHTVEFYYPSKGGSQEVVRQLSERMVAMGHTVTVVTTKLPERTSLTHNGVSIVEFEIEGNEVRGYKGDTEAYRRFIKEGKFDVIMNYAAQQWASDLVYDLLPEITAKKIFVPCGFSGLHDPAYAEFFKKMPEILNQYDKTVYLSDSYRDAEFAKKHNIKNMVIIPNGADEREFLTPAANTIKAKLGIDQASRVVFHLGSFTGQKGQPEAIKIFKKSKVNNATLLLVGNIFDVRLYRSTKLKALLFNLNPLNKIKKRTIHVCALNREDTLDALKTAKVFLFPSNIEASPLVLFEACAAKLPFLTSDVGNAKEIIEWTGGGLLLKSSKDDLGQTHVDVPAAAKVLEKVLSDNALHDKLASSGFKAWKKSFTWEKITKEYLAIYGGKSA